MRENDVYLISEYNLYNLLQFSSMHILGRWRSPCCTWKITHSFSCEIFKRRNPHSFVSVNLSIRAGGSL